MDYKAIVEEAKQRALEYLSDTDGWKLSNKSTDQISIESKPSKKYNCNVWRIKLYVDNAPVKLCEETISMRPGTRRIEWDPDVREIKLLKSIDENTHLFYVHTNSVGKGVISPREFVDVYRTEEKPDDILSYGCSVDHPPMTTDDKYVRAFDGCWVFRIYKDPTKEGRTIVQSISEAEFRGWIPGALLNSTIPAVMIHSLTTWMEFLKK